MNKGEKSNKKVGLVPLLYNEYNYGGILQLYALQFILKKLEYKVDIIEFNNDEKIRDVRNTSFWGDYSKIKGLIREFARKKNLIIINIPFASVERIDAEMFGDEKIIDASLGEFLSLIRNAKYVFTDSFYACVFSTLFEKEFYVFERDEKSSMMDRILTLQENFQLPNRIIPVKEIREQSNIDYSNNKPNQNRLRNQSLRYLTESLVDE